MVDKMYKIEVFDGDKKKLYVELPREKLEKMIRESILQGVMASQKIEGEEIEMTPELEKLISGIPIPECLLETPPSFPPFCF